MNTVSATELVRRFTEYINRVVYRSESFRVVRNDRAVAELRPVPNGRTLGDLAAMMSNLPHLTEGEADAFARDIVEARRELASKDMENPWVS